jgi:hypothetical protein
MEYKILIGTSPGWIGNPIIVKLLSDLTYQFDLIKAIWQSQRLKEAPKLEFKINQTTSLPDLILAGPIWIISNRLLVILKNYGVVFESFPVTLFGDDAVITNYYLFHLLQVRSIIDLQNSKIQKQEIRLPDSVIHVDEIEGITLLEMERNAELSMIRDSFLTNLVFLREDLINLLEQEQVTGFRCLNPKEYHFNLKEGWR